MTCPYMSGPRWKQAIAASPGVEPDNSSDTNHNNLSTTRTIMDDDDNPAMHYNKYLKLDAILSAQELESERQGCKVHDEHLFIIVHQVYELWFKQILYEIDSVCDLLSQIPFNERRQLVVNQRMGRITGITKILVEQIHVLETMTPMDFLEFRSYLAPASGFESQQFRLLENRIGIKPEWRVKYAQRNYESAHQGELLEEIKQSEREPSLLDIVEKWLERTPGLEPDGFNFWQKYQDAAKDMMDGMKKCAEQAENQDEKEALMREHSLAQQTFESVFNEEQHKTLVSRGDRRFSHKALQGALLISLYREELRFSQPFQFLTLLVDLDSLVMKWRMNHVQLVQRMIGCRPGTGGSAGYMYLKATSSDRYKVFVDLYNLSTFLLPRKYIPALNADMKLRLSNGENTGNNHSQEAEKQL